MRMDVQEYLGEETDMGSNSGFTSLQAIKQVTCVPLDCFLI